MLAKLISEALGLVYREEWAVTRIFEEIGNIAGNFSVKGLISTIVIIAELAGMLLFGSPVSPRGQELDLTGYELIFSDEFEGDTLNTDVWFTRGNGPRRGGYNADSQVRVENGNLVITAEYLNEGEYGEGWYTGAVALKEKYTRGYFEIRCICNPGGGFWSAFWLQADHPYEAEYSKGGIGGAEIDIFEAMGYNNTPRDYITSTIHCAGVDGVKEGFQSAMLGDFKANNIYEEYNTYGLEWTEDEYIFYINGVETTRSTFGNGVSEASEQVIVSLEIPEEEKLQDFDTTAYSTDFIVDYVKIYQK